MGEELDECFTTWEQFYREKSHEPVPVTNSIEFRVQGDGNTIANLVGGGYLFDNVTNTTATSGGPAPTTCGLAAEGLIAPTATTCAMYRDGQASALGSLSYNVKGTKINAVAPGVFFYYTKVSADGGETVNITQENDVAATLTIPIQQGQAVLYNATTCAKVPWKPTVADGTVEATLPAGDFIIGVKYDASSLKGKTAPSATVTYSFGTELNDTPVQLESTIQLLKK